MDFKVLLKCGTGETGESDNSYATILIFDVYNKYNMRTVIKKSVKSYAKWIW